MKQLVISATNRSLILAILAIASGLLAAWAAREHIQERIEQIEAQAQVPTVPRIVAAYDLAAGTKLENEYVAVRDIPKQWAASDTLEPEAFAQYAGAVLGSSIKKGDPILTLHLLKETPAPLSSRLKSGRRAVTLPVDEINSLSGLLQPGDVIDLYVSFKNHDQPITAALLQGVPILATGKQAQEGITDHSSFSSITIDISPQDALKLMTARQTGTITSVLRHHGDPTVPLSIVPGDLPHLLGIHVPKPKISPPVQILYGDELESNNDKKIVFDEEKERAVLSNLKGKAND